MTAHWPGWGIQLKYFLFLILGTVCLAIGFGTGFYAKDYLPASLVKPAPPEQEQSTEPTLPALDGPDPDSTDETIAASLDSIDLAALSETYRISPITETESPELPDANSAETTSGTEASNETTPEPVTTAQQSGAFPDIVPTEMTVCPTTVSNAPAMDDKRNITSFKAAVDVNGVPILLAPATKSCLSSGFGPRGSSGRLHKGLDYYTRQNGDVLAAGAGEIVEANFRDDYGNMIVVDHGNGVYTRYAHLASIARGIDVGAKVEAGDILGPIGATGSYTSVVHLHYEVMTGDYNTPKKSFGLTPIDPFAQL